MRCFSTIALAASMAMWCLCPTASAGTFTWTRAADSDGWWATKLIPESDPQEYMNNWGHSGDPPAFPDAGDDAVISKAIGGWNVSLSPNASVHDLTVGSDDSLTIRAILTVYGDSISNAGQITIDKASVITYMNIDDANTVLSGGGALTLIDASVRGKDGDERLINVDNTISGGASLGAGDLALTNHALIDANATGTLQIYPNAGGVINTGTMQASDGGTLKLYGENCVNTGAVIQALDGSEVMLDDVSVTEGTVSTSGTGIVTIHHQTILQDVQNTGNMQAVGSNIVLKGTFTNAGSVETVSTFLYTRIRVDGTVTLNGGGTITLGGTKILVEGIGDGGDLDNVDNTISGGGYLGNGSLGSLTNTGTIEATGTNVLQVDLLGTVGMTNDGTIRAVGSGGLYFADDTFTNTDNVEIFSGSELKVRTSGSGNYIQTGGTTWLDDNAVLKAKNVYIQGGSVVGAGTLDTTDVIVTAGTVAPGLSTGLLTVDGNYSQSADGTLEIELGGLARGSEYDVLIVTGEASLAGTLDVTLLPGFNPSVGASFDILDWGSLAGSSAFDPINLPELGSRFEWDTSELYTTGVLAVLYDPIPGDANRDGFVNEADAAILATNWQTLTGAIWAMGDFNGDYAVNDVDAAILAANWQSAASGAVPEPGTITLAALGLLVLVFLGSHKSVNPGHRPSSGSVHC